MTLFKNKDNKKTVNRKPAQTSRTYNGKSKRNSSEAKHYTVWDGSRGGKTFKTANEAIAYSNDILYKSGEIVAVTATRKQITHSYRESTRKK